jgi:hypothetical protein
MIRVKIEIAYNKHPCLNILKVSVMVFSILLHPEDINTENMK